MDHEKPHTEAVDRISGLPPPILHHILSFLPLKAVLRTSVLSKTWNDVCVSYPNLQFNGYRYRGSVKQFGNYVDTSLNKFSEKEVKMKIFKVLFVAPVKPITALITKWLALILEMEVEEVVIRCHDSQQSVTPAASLMSPLKFRFSSENNSLRRIHLGSIVLDEKTLGNLFTFCPLIEELELCRVSGLQRIRVPKVERLRKIYIDSLGDVRIDIGTDSIRELTILDTNCTSLIKNLASRFPVLETLKLVECYWQKGDSLEILSPSLKILELQCNEGHGRINIDTPNLCSFKFFGKKIRPFRDTLVAPCQWDIKLSCLKGDVGTSWFVYLKNFLARSNQVTEFSCDFREAIFSFSLEEAAEKTNLSSVPVVEKFCLSYGGYNEMSEACFAALLDGFLWCCHPKIIYVEYNQRVGSKRFVSYKLDFERFLRKEFKPKDYPLLCCSSTPIKCWRHDLKSVDWNKSEDLGFELTWGP